MEATHNMNTLAEAMNVLKEKGYTEDFKFADNRLIAGNKKYKAENLKIAEVYRFEGESDPSDMSVLFAIETDDGKKGLIAEAYGFYGAQNGDNIEDFIKNIERPVH